MIGEVANVTSGSRISIVTPARNEVGHLPRLIESIVGQTLRPFRWVIVSDGSTDGTDKVALEAAAQWPFIDFVRRDDDGGRDFAKKVSAIELGRTHVDGDEDFFGNVDADVEFPSGYFEALVEQMRLDPSLGVAGGLVVDVDEDGCVHGRPGRPDIVPGAVQLFRRSCFDEVGGYMPLRNGSEDTVACLVAQMRGWRTAVIDTLEVRHHRTSGTADRSLLRARYREGKRDYAIGYHPLFALAKGVKRIPERPVLVGALARVVGFSVGLAGRQGPEVADDVVAYLRARQLAELKIRR